MNGACINCGGLVYGDRARCVACELDAGLVLAFHGEANCRNRADKPRYQSAPKPRYRSILLARSDRRHRDLEDDLMADIPACPICKRLPRDGHDSYCTPERRENAERDRLAIDPPEPMRVRHGPVTTTTPTESVSRLFRKEPNMAPTLAEAVANLGLPAPSADRPIDEPVVEMAECATCGTKPRAQFSTKLNGDPFANCDPCRSAKAKAAHAARRTVNKPADSVNETPVLVNEAIAPLTMADAGAPMVNQGSAGDDQVDVEQLLGKVGESDEDLDQVAPIAPEPSRTFQPNGDASLTPDRPQSVADLRAERARLTSYLEDLDRRIEEAEVFEQLAGKSPDEIRQLLDDAQRQVRLCQLALQGAA